MISTWKITHQNLFFFIFKDFIIKCVTQKLIGYIIGVLLFSFTLFHKEITLNTHFLNNLYLQKSKNEIDCLWFINSTENTKCSKNDCYNLA